MMLFSIIFLIISLGVILIAAEAFTNGLEVLGKRFSFSQAVVGNLLAAVGTAMPETILPVVAIFFTKSPSAKDIGVGAILGAPFMISTLAFLLIGITVLVCAIKKRRKFEIKAEPDSIKRDLCFFIPMYSIAVFVPLFTGRLLAIPIAILLIAGYILYVNLTIKGRSAGIEHLEGLHLFKFQKRLRFTKLDAPHITLITLQIIGAIVIMLFGAHLFVNNLEYMSLKLGMSPLLFALMLAPIATELPEKFNSIAWTLKGKDTLAIGNLTGAMVFQSTFPVSIGLLFTDWKLTTMAIFSAVLALLSAVVVLIILARKKRISPFAMLLGGVFYFIYVVALVFNVRL